MLSRFLIAGLIAAVLSSAALRTQAQVVGVGPGSTPSGDMLRGAGVAAYGAGLRDYYDAAANSTNIDSFIKFNGYINEFYKEENRENHRIAQATRKKARENWDKIQVRIDKDPSVRDINQGDALNAKTRQLLMAGSALRYSKTLLPPDTIRRLPFALPRKGLTFSMQRMALKSPKQWPVALQDSEFHAVRQAYVRAFGKALDQIEGKQTLAAIKDVENALSALHAQLDRVIDPTQLKEEDRELYNQAKNHLKRLGVLTDVLKDHDMQKVLVEMENYSGTTLADLLEFVTRHHLQFAISDPGDELTTTRKLHLLMEDELAALGPEKKN